MKIIHKTNVTLLVGLVAISTIAASGCRTGGFSKPDLTKLAFWKKDGDILASNDIPPPARHFNPAPIGGDATPSSQVVDLDGSKFRNRNVSDVKLAGKGSNADSPIREPYSSGLADTVQKQLNEFEADSNRVKSKLDGFAAAPKSELTTAQKDFQSAMQGTGNAFGGGFGSPASPSNDMTKGWKDNLELPTGLANVKQNSDESLAAINRSLYDANGKLAGTTSEAANAFNNKLSELNSQAGGFKNSFDDKLNSAANAINGVQSAAVKSVADASTNAFGSQGFAPPTGNGTQFANDAPTSSGFGMPGNGGFAAAPSAGLVPAANAVGKQQELEAVQAQVADARQQIELLKQQVADAKRRSQVASPGFVPPSAPNAFGADSGGSFGANAFPTDVNGTANVAQSTRSNQTNPGQFPAAPFQSAYGAGSDLTKPNNTLRNDGALGSTGFASPNAAPNYPSTPHSQFAPQGGQGFGTGQPSATSVNSKASFQSDSNQSMVVNADASNTNPGFASKIQNHVSDVDIPASVLSGRGSYAPGSVNSLQSDR